MKKWLIWCLTVLAMVCLIPGIVLKAAAETVPVHCAFCGIREEREVRRYEKYDSNYHKVYVTECQNCHNDGNITHLQVHSGGWAFTPAVAHGTPTTPSIFLTRGSAFWCWTARAVRPLPRRRQWKP